MYYLLNKPFIFIIGLLLTVIGQLRAEVPPVMETVHPVFENVEQLVVVVADDWDATKGKLVGYTLTNGQWVKNGEEVKVVLGRTGMAWGNGLHPFTADKAPVKQEGDGKTPAGIFRIGVAFGYADPQEVLFTRLPYLMANEFFKCIDDVQSQYYNRIVSTDIAQKDWSSAEDMKRKDHQYKWGIVIEQNTQPIEKGKGSCVFFHLYKTPDSPTAGCTAMSETEMKNFMKWLDPSKRPLLVQLPKTAYSTHKEALGLPDM